MTAEIVVMNREGVALAADSLVTIGYEKTFDTATKLHQLAHNLPVAFMIYNVGTFMEMPWEVVLHQYRDSRPNGGKEFSKLEDYAEDFTNFLRANEKTISNEGQQRYYLGVTTERLLKQLTDEIIDKLKQELFTDPQRIPESRIIEIATEAINENLASRQAVEEVAFTSGKDRAFRKRVIANFGQLINELIDKYFDKLPITEEQREDVIEYILLSLTKRWGNPFYTGVVFAGYGKDDRLPKCAECRVEYLVSGELKSTPLELTSVSFTTGLAAAILPFAQDDVAHTILSGRHPQYLESVGNRVEREVGTETTAQILNDIEQSFYYGYTSRILETLNLLPREDLPLVAETMVNLTSFMRKVSKSMETVGGPTDVALITKKDGLIWIRRKHYFDIAFNPQFAKHTQ